MKKLIVIVAGLLCSGLSYAAPVSASKAQATAVNFYKSLGRNMVTLSLAYQPASKAYYVFNNDAQGFIIISGDDKAMPVLGYSDESVFDIGKISAEARYWLGKYDQQITYAAAHDVPPLPAATAAWADMADATHVAARTTSTLALMHSTWNQTPLYNAMCPASGGDTAVTGCVATAMAQVMYYWKWPATGVGSHSYYAGGYGPQSVNFASSNYMWDSMANHITVFNNYVAKINYDAGVSVNMNYGATESGAFVTEAESPITNCAEYALKTYFNYTSTLHGELRANYTDTAWRSLIVSEINASRPVIYSGSGPQGGHCWVADGYRIYADTVTFIHFNWGWGGYGNGFFLLSNIAPVGNTFNDDQTAIVGIYPSIGAASVATVTGSDKISIYPNPATQMITIDAGGAALQTVTITDMAGREVYNAKVSGASATISVAAYPAGEYLVQVTAGDNTTTRKVVVTH